MQSVKIYHLGDAGLIEGESLSRISVVLKADYERMYEAVLFATECFNTISSADGSGHADLGRAVLRIAGIAKNNPQAS